MGCLAGYRTPRCSVFRLGQCSLGVAENLRARDKRPSGPPVPDVGKESDAAKITDRKSAAVATMPGLGGTRTAT